MVHVPGDLGQRIVQAAYLAAALHNEAVEEIKQGRPALLGGNAAGSIKDDGPSQATMRRASLSLSSWTSAGEHPAGSFAA
jgi:hypothetical protein